MTVGHGDTLAAADYSVQTLTYVSVLLIASGVLPLLVGVWAGRRLPPRVGAMGPDGAVALALGAAAFLFVDYLKEAADLGQATGRAPLIAGLVASFVVGLLAFAGAAARRAPLGPALVWAGAVGLHGLGEGLLVASDIASDAFVMSLTQGVSFGIHKGIEGFILGALLARAGATGPSRGLAGLAAGPLVAGALAAPFAPALAPSVAFAAGAGAALLTVFHLGPPAAGGPLSVRTATWVLVGALVVFGAGLLHQF